jgi:hypothetical protein
MKTGTPCLLKFEISPNRFVILLASIYLFLIASRIFVDKTYSDVMLPDLFGFLDGIYRISLGQAIHRDFSSPQGVFVYGVPATFMYLGAEPISSVRYSEAFLAFIAFFIYLYIQRTRLDTLPALFFGVWIPLALVARMNFGDPLYLVTEAMHYNRYCVVYLTLLLLLFIPSCKKQTIHLMIDGILYGAICAFLFYSKITFGLVAIGFAPVILLRRREVYENIMVICCAVITFWLISSSIEYGYGTHFLWWRDIDMAISSSEGSSNLKGLIKIVTNNTPELIACLFIPAFVLLSQHKLNTSLFLFCIMLAGSSTLLIAYSAQQYVLSLPIVFLFIALNILKVDQDDIGVSSEQKINYFFLVVLTVGVSIAQSSPLLVNVVFSTIKSLSGTSMDEENRILKTIVTMSPTKQGGADWVSSMQDFGSLQTMSTLDVLAFARETKPRHLWDNLWPWEYATYLKDGIRAAREGCANHARISTLDFVNPFPLLLGWPEGGGMVYIHPGYLLSEKAHLANDIMFRDITCIMVPKLPDQKSSRDLMLKIYGSYLSKAYTLSHETDMWTVLSKTVGP